MSHHIDKVSEHPRPKKALGQHFLKDPNYIRKILQAAEILPTDIILEIGPGQGQITRLLAEKAHRVIAIELDRALYALLKEKLSDLKNVKLIQANAMTFDYHTLEGPLKVVANLPYYIATALIFKLLEIRRKFTALILMVQKEVAQRIVAQPGSKDYGLLSIALQFYTEPRLLFSVPRTCFLPRPKVDSAVIQLKVLQKPCCPVKDEDWLFRVVRAGFSHRRKYLSNALMDEGFPSESVYQALQQTGIDPRRRAETLTLLEFCTLADQLWRAGRGR